MKIPKMNENKKFTKEEMAELQKMTLDIYIEKVKIIREQPDNMVNVAAYALMTDIENALAIAYNLGFNKGKEESMGLEPSISNNKTELH